LTQRYPDIQIAVAVLDVNDHEQVPKVFAELSDTLGGIDRVAVDPVDGALGACPQFLKPYDFAADRKEESAAEALDSAEASPLLSPRSDASFASLSARERELAAAVNAERPVVSFGVPRLLIRPTMPV
ncbi:MAG: hypothetical protein ACRDNS_22345, partial [Trebonia sp.]